MNILLFSSFFFAQSFLTNAPLRHVTRLQYNGNEKNKNQLRGIDYKLNRFKKQMMSLLEEKKALIKNMTDIDLSISTKDYFSQLMDQEEEEYIIRIEIPQENHNTNENTETKSENFEVFRNKDLNFKCVGGYNIIKHELLQCADILVNYTKYAKYNVRTPKGIILEGPPGNGKTLLAKCFSGEIDVAFIPVSGAQFQEKYVGVGASRVRELFDLASQNVPCIIFIDEMDALCRKRTDGASNSEHDSTLNELLVNMDGFKRKPGIFIMGATNRIDLLDNAVTRPGRIDKKIFVGNPDETTRKAILRIHMKGKPIDKNIKIEDLLQMTETYSGAQIENFLNEAMLLALRENRQTMTRQDLEIMSTRTLTGFQSIETKITQDQLYQVAIHEMGHAFTAILTGTRKVKKVAIHLWSPKSLGFTLFDTQDNTLPTKESLLGELMVLLGGRVAEDLFFGNNISIGASQDLEQTKQLAEKMVMNWGMGDRVIYPSVSEFYRKILEQEMDELIQTAYRETKELLTPYIEQIQDMAEQLVETRELSGEELSKSI